MFLAMGTDTIFGSDSNFSILKYWSQLFGYTGITDAPIGVMFSAAPVSFLSILLLMIALNPGSDRKCRIFQSTLKGRIILNKLKDLPPHKHLDQVIYYVKR